MKRYLLFLLPLLLLTSCIDEEELDNNPQGNFEALWKIMDEHYCFFTEKGVDWDAVHEICPADRQLHDREPDV